MNELQIFNSLEFGQVRVLEMDGEPWFVAKDVCNVLDLSNPTIAISRLDDDEVTKFNLGGLSGETNIVNEYGLYSLVLGSRKPEARQFKRWITHEVIPAIRKTGLYKRPLTRKEEVRLYLAALEEQEEKINAVSKDLQELKNDLPLLGVECDRIVTAVKRKGVDCLGGKASAAYQDGSIRNKVYSDIYRQLKREFAISSYKAIKRNQTDFAIRIINNYRPPFALNEEIEECNRQMGM